jgi:hypothetical protein
MGRREAGERKGYFRRVIFEKGPKSGREEEKMKRNVLLALAMAMVFGLTLYPLEGKAMMGGGMGSGMMGGGDSWSGGGLIDGLGSWLMGRGNSGMGPGGGQGMGPGSGQGAGPGLNGPGYGRQDDFRSQQQLQPQKPLARDEARRMLERYLKSTRNPNLHPGRIEDKGNTFEANVLTKDNSLADKILIDKNTGSMRSAY